MKAIPLENYSSLHELSLMELLSSDINWPRQHFFIQFSFNLHTPLKIHPQAYLALHTQDAHLPPSAPDLCYCIEHLTRWQLDISSYQSIDDYLKTLNHSHRRNNEKAKNLFFNYGCKTSMILGDWSEHVERVYQLYAHVAKRYKYRLYDLDYFQKIAKRPDYSLLCAWFQGEMIGVFVLQEEFSTLHSICCGFDYKHSSASCAYSWMHCAYIEHAIALQKYQNVDVGLSSDEAKRTIGFQPILSRMDIYSQETLTRGFLKIISCFIHTTLNSEGKIKLE